MTTEFEHWCGNCQIRIYVERHYGIRLSYQDCPYNCKYGTKMRGSIELPKTIIEMEQEDNK